MSRPSHLITNTALEDFHRAHRQAAMQEILARVTGAPVDLLSFEDVRQKFKIARGSEHGRQQIPLTAIVGSVGRYSDFTRTFLPRIASDRERWAGIKTAAAGLKGLPPIEVYQIDQVYFVVDGNHRVSVARQLGQSHIEAYVTEFKTKVHLEPGDRPDDLIIKAEYADFLERTRLDELRPYADLRVTVPGRYWELETYIEAQRFLIGQEQDREIAHDEAACYWYDHVYSPLAQVIRERGILRDFPDRTETDLFLWIIEHRSTLQKKLGWRVDLDAAATDLATERSHRPKRVVTRIEGKLSNSMTPDPLDTGPKPGQWRRERLNARSNDRLFAAIMVPISGDENGWHALEQALLVAQREHSRVFGLHVVSSEAQKESANVQALQAEFSQRCQAAGLSGELSVEAGKLVPVICDRVQWADLMVMYPANPPGPGMMAKLSSGSRTIIHRSSRPVLMVPTSASSLNQALLAYDGSPKAQEGLFVATYLASQWQLLLTVMTVIEKKSDEKRLAQAQEYLEVRGVAAQYMPVRGEVSEAILSTADQLDSDLIIMGGYGSKPIREVVLGNAVGRVLRRSHRPMLICR